MSIYSPFKYGDKFHNYGITIKEGLLVRYFYEGKPIIAKLEVTKYNKFVINSKYSNIYKCVSKFYTNIAKRDIFGNDYDFRVIIESDDMEHIKIKNQYDCTLHDIINCEVISKYKICNPVNNIMDKHMYRFRIDPIAHTGYGNRNYANHGHSGKGLLWSSYKKHIDYQCFDYENEEFQNFDKVFIDTKIKRSYVDSGASSYDILGKHGKGRGWKRTKKAKQWM